MPARSPDGLAPHDCSPIPPCELASPTSSVLYKFTRFRCFFPLQSDTSPSSINCSSRIDPSPYHNSDTHSDHRTPGPAKPPKRGKGKIAVARQSARPPATAGRQADGPERSPSAPRGPHKIDRPAARACPRPGRPSALADRREAIGRRCGAGAVLSRWSL